MLAFRHIVLTVCCLGFGHTFAHGPSDILVGQWINGLGDIIEISSHSDQLRLEIVNECFMANISVVEAEIDIIPYTPDIFCLPKPDGVSGSLDALRSGLRRAQNYELIGDILSFSNNEGRILLAFDRYNEISQ